VTSRSAPASARRRQPTPPPAAPPAVRATGGERLNRYLARHGVASRRAADTLVEAGRVEVNGARAALGTLVDPAADRVTVDGQPVGEAVPLRTLMLNKPPGTVSTRSDPQGRPTVLDHVDDPRGLSPVGRLDTDSRGLLLLSSDGALTLRLTHPRYGITKRYRAIVDGYAGPAALRRITEGVTLDDGPARALEVHHAGTTRRGEVVDILMAEGRKREVRRLLAAVGLRVTDLCRVAVGPLGLGHLREGHARPLTTVELREVYAAVGLTPPKRR
jgi:pseudouridine synthase